MHIRIRTLWDKAGDGSGGGGAAGGNSGGAGAGAGQSGSPSDGGGAGGSGTGAGGPPGDGKSGSASDPLFGSPQPGSGDSGKPGAGGAGGTGTGANNPNGATGGSPNEIVFPTNWKDALPDDIKNSAFIQQVPDVPTLAKNYANAQKMIGADKIVMPNKFTTSDEWKTIFQKLGNPEKITDYNMDLDKNFEKTLDKTFLEKFTETAHKNGVLPQQSKAMIEWFAKLNETMVSDQRTNYEKTLTDGMNGLKNEWGKAWDQNLIRAKAAVNEYADAETQQFLKDAGLGKNANFLKLMSKIGESLSEDKIRGHGGDIQANELSPAQAMEKYNEILNTPKHAYFEKNHENHIAAKKEVARLFAMAYPS
jgi:hypothetical protein